MKILIFDEAICDLKFFKEKLKEKSIFLTLSDILYIIKTILDTF
jgi:hypothetical protein